tara:strand:+ start:4413 stop:4607 length:195 start_codon:yes stop_codon:yes gene_type:complete
MEFDFLNVFLVIYAANFACEMTFFSISFIMQYYKMRQSKKNMELLRQNLETQLKNSIGDGRGGK